MSDSELIATKLKPKAKKRNVSDKNSDLAEDLSVKDIDVELEETGGKKKKKKKPKGSDRGAMRSSCRFFENEFPEVDEYVMVNVQRCVHLK